MENHSSSVTFFPWLSPFLIGCNKIINHRKDVVHNKQGWSRVGFLLRLPTHGEDNCLPPHPLILDVKITHDHYGRTTQYTNGSFTHRISSNDAPQSDDTFEKYGQEENTPLRSTVRG